MIEDLLAKSDLKGYYPDSGPGNKWLLYGDTQVGYFGKVYRKDLDILSTLYQDAELSSSVQYFKTETELNNFTWHKFFYKEKVLFVPGNPIGYTSHANLYRKGMLHGDFLIVEKDSSKKGFNPTNLSEVSQDKHYLVNDGNDKDVMLIVRTPRLIDDISVSLPSAIFNAIQPNNELGLTYALLFGNVGTYKKYISNHDFKGYYKNYPIIISNHLNHSNIKYIRYLNVDTTVRGYSIQNNILGGLREPNITTSSTYFDWLPILELNTEGFKVGVSNVYSFSNEGTLFPERVGPLDNVPELDKSVGIVPSDEQNNKAPITERVTLEPKDEETKLFGVIPSEEKKNKTAFSERVEFTDGDKDDSQSVIPSEEQNSKTPILERTTMEDTSFHLEAEHEWDIPYFAGEEVFALAVNLERLDNVRVLNLKNSFDLY